MDFNLDFDLVTSDERRDFIASKDLSKLTQKEIELCGNYILYGKDRSNNPEINGTSCVDRKEVQIQTNLDQIETQVAQAQSLPTVQAQVIKTQLNLAKDKLGPRYSRFMLPLAEVCLALSFGILLLGSVT